MGPKIVIDEQVSAISVTEKVGSVQSRLKTGFISISWLAALLEFDPDYQAILDRGSLLGYSLPTGGQQIKQNQFVLDLKAQGIWPLLDVLYVFAGDGDANFSKLNWKAPSAFFPAQVGTVNFISMQGFKAAAGGYFDLGWVPSISGVNWTLNDASVGLVGVENLQNNFYDFGASSPNALTVVKPRTFSDTNGVSINGGSLFASGILNTTGGVSHYQRTSSTTLRSLQNGVQTGIATSSSQNITPLSLFLMDYNNVGVPGGQSSAKTFSMLFLGASLSGKEAAFNTAWGTYVSGGGISPLAVLWDTGDEILWDDGNELTWDS